VTERFTWAKVRNSASEWRACVSRFPRNLVCTASHTEWAMERECGTMADNLGEMAPQSQDLTMPSMHAQSGKARMGSS
jgi:hypothetical protein